MAHRGRARRTAPRGQAQLHDAAAPVGVSLARALSKLAVCSRSQALSLIESGRVRVNGHALKDPRVRVRLGRDRVEVDGRAREETRAPTVIALHKPVGYITSRHDPGGRSTVYDLLADQPRWVFPVGRLDRDTSGLLILTDDHRLGQRLTDPQHKVPKTYHVRVRGVLDAEALRALREGVPLEDGLTRPTRVRTLGANRDGTSWLELVVSEGRNRQVRRMCAAVGHDVVQLVRVGIGRFVLGALRSGAWRPLTREETALLAERRAPG